MSEAAEQNPSEIREPPPAVVLLGSQRFSPMVGETVKARQLEGRIALITAGWQEREGEDEELRNHLEGTTVNLELHRRTEQVFAEDPELADAHRLRQQTLRHKQDFYRIRLQHEVDANHVIRQRKAPPEVLEEEKAASLSSIRALDEWHVKQCARIHQEFTDRMQTHQRDAVRRHRDELKEILAGCSGIAIAGGHVASLVNRMFLFGIRKLIDGHTIFAWSAGAMAITERIVLFHDTPPQGHPAPEILDQGVGLVSGIVVMPQPEKRLNLNDTERVAMTAGRFSPSHCIAFPKGAHVTLEGGKFVAPEGVVKLDPDGTSRPFREGAA